MLDVAIPAVTSVNRNAVNIVFLIAVILLSSFSLVACISNFVPSEYRGG
jgi:hypothetical protein